MAMSWIELLVMIPLVAIACRMLWLQLTPGPKPRWRSLFLTAAVTALAALASVLNRPGASGMWWAFFAFGMVMMLVALLVLKPRDEMMP
jgi:hypothetical protein